MNDWIKFNELYNISWVAIEKLGMYFEFPFDDYWMSLKYRWDRDISIIYIYIDIYISIVNVVSYNYSASSGHSQN